MQSLGKYNNRTKCLLCAIDLLSKYAWVVPLKDKRGITIINAFSNIISKGRKPNNVWVDEGGGFYNNLFKRFLKIDCIEIYSTCNEGKSVVAERFIRMLKNKIFNDSSFKKCWFWCIDNIVKECKRTVLKTIKIKPIDVTSDFHAEYNEDSNEIDPKFKVDDRVRISIYKNIFAKGYT